jgi:predicted phage gp36 major capsid-like protein
VREWYAEYRREHAHREALPPCWKDLGLNPDQWTSYLNNKRRRDNARAEAAAQLTKAAENYRKEQQRIENQLQGQLRSSADNVTLIVESNIESLPLDARVRIESHTGEERTAHAAKELEQARRGWIEKIELDHSTFRQEASL